MFHTVNGVQLAVDDGGTGPTALVFLHYFGGSGQSWQAVVGDLEGSYRCVVPDLRGFGNSDAPVDGYSVADGADDIAALVAALGLDSYILIGHSMGGKIALTLAARQPRGLRGLVLLAPSPPTPEPMTDADRQRLLDGYGQREQAQDTVEAITARPLSPEVEAAVIADNICSSRAAWTAWLEHGSRENIAEHMPQVTVPVVVVVGQEDDTIPLDVQQREVMRYLPHAQLRTVAHAGHLLPLEAPDAVIAAIRQVADHHDASIA